MGFAYQHWLCCFYVYGGLLDQKIQELLGLHERREESQCITRRNAWSMRERYIPNPQVNMSFGIIAQIVLFAFED
jgi:hypothetical protein